MTYEQEDGTEDNSEDTTESTSKGTSDGTRMEGTVKWFNSRKGFGFIQGEDGQDYFVHHSALPQGAFLKENDKVSFEATETDRGKQAKNVQLL